MIARPETIAKAIQALEQTQRPVKSQIGGEHISVGAWERQRKKNVALMNRLLGES